jgi:hypothetical protein
MKKIILPFIVIFCLSVEAFAVEYYELLNDPDNIELNEQFAKERIAIGDFSAALSAIERVLIQTPTNTPLRLLRAELLISLGNDSLAENELSALVRLPLTKNQKIQAIQLLDTVKNRTSLSKNTLAIGFGVLGSDNSNSYPSSGMLEFVMSGVPSTNTYNSFGGHAKKVSNSAAFTNLSLTNEFDLSTQKKDVLISTISTRFAGGSKDDFLNSKTVGINLGANLKRLGVNWMPRVGYSKIKGDTSADLVMKTVALNGVIGLSNRASANFKLSKAKLVYTNDATFTTANQSNGKSTNATLGLDYALKSNLIATISHSRGKFAPDSSQFTIRTSSYLNSIANKKDTKNTAVSLAYIVSSGSRVMFNHTLSTSEHKNLDPTSLKIRDDSQKTTSIGFMKSGKEMSELLKNWQFGINATRSANDSNIMQFDYKRNDWSLSAMYSIKL